MAGRLIRPVHIHMVPVCLNSTFCLLFCKSQCICFPFRRESKHRIPQTVQNVRRVVDLHGPGLALSLLQLERAHGRGSSQSAQEKKTQVQAPPQRGTSACRGQTQARGKADGRRHIQLPVRESGRLQHGHQEDWNHGEATKASRKHQSLQELQRSPEHPDPGAVTQAQAQGQFQRAAHQHGAGRGRR